ncbi:MAG: NAD+ synthase, partial [Chloroflexi bacterium]|nr:NAD+ synthase [Chloroflexota bacterium]
MTTLRVALAQINTTVGDLAGNSAKIVDYIGRARALGADLVAFPELAVTGYPPEDLLFKPSFIAENLRRLQEVAAAARDITVVVGFVDRDGDIYNAAAVIHDGRVVGVHHKNYLPNYGVFDEDRYFRAGTTCPVFIIAGVPVGVNVCEDIWYPTGPVARQVATGAEVIVTINASPYHHGRQAPREHMVGTRAHDNGAFVCYVNQVGGQDELVFDGASVIFNHKGEAIARAPQFQEELLVADLAVEDAFRHRLRDPRRRKEQPGLAAAGTAPLVTVGQSPAPRQGPALPASLARPQEPLAEMYGALALGTRDYVTKNRFQKVVIGLSGGIDSSMVTTIAADALGPE